MTNIQLNSEAERKIIEGGLPPFARGINLSDIKSSLADILEHIGDNNMFIEYTMHNITHIDGMLNLLNKIIPAGTKEAMTQADWLMSVLAIYFHDIGMYITQEEFEERDSDPGFVLFAESVRGKTENAAYLETLKDGNDNRFLYQEYVRRNHGKRAYDWITHCNDNDKMPYQLVRKMLGNLDADFRSDLALVCQSHNENSLSEKLQMVDVAYGAGDQEKANLLYCSILLRVSDILHFTSDRTPTVEYWLVNPQNEVSKMEWMKQQGIKSVDPRTEKDSNGNNDATIESTHLSAKGVSETKRPISLSQHSLRLFRVSWNSAINGLKTHA